MIAGSQGHSLIRNMQLLKIERKKVFQRGSKYTQALIVTALKKLCLFLGSQSWGVVSGKYIFEARIMEVAIE